jgi:SepF-like predicted cell division protein (DUF552 family)
MNRNKRNKNGLLSFAVIEKAAGGDADAINKVLKHYEGYIVALSVKRLRAGDGRTYTVVDEEMRRTLETKLIVKLLRFDLKRAA